MKDLRIDRLAARLILLVAIALTPASAHVDLAVGVAVQPPVAALGRAERVAPGIDLYRLNDEALLSPPGPVAVQVLRLDPRRVLLRSTLAKDRVIGVETVEDMARRHHAIAAINAGFFLPSGDPDGLLKVQHDLVSDNPLLRGAVIVDTALRTGTSLVFDRIAVTFRLHIGEGPDRTTLAVTGINTARAGGALVWFTPRFFVHTDTTTGGAEVIVRGTPPRVVERRECAMRSSIPPDGGVLAFDGCELPPLLAGLRPGAKVEVEPVYTTGFGTPQHLLEHASDIVGGAGLLVKQGRAIRDWSVERLRKGFDTERHPRTMIGVDEDGRILLVTIDGRNKAISLGMNFDELLHLAAVLRLRDALNLDGGGSTTMVVRGHIVNHPSDASGPRKVSDALLVFSR